jgi:3-hydroxybutyryl-CoA dehydratase
MEALPSIAPGKTWRELPVGWKARTSRRTVTEADLVAFISATGMLERIFTDAEHRNAIGGRPVPAALTYCFIEGMQLQTLVHGTGLALLEANTIVDAPVRVGDTIGATVEVIASRTTAEHDRAVVTFLVEVYNQRGQLVMHYEAKRLMSGEPG